MLLFRQRPPAALFRCCRHYSASHHRPPLSPISDALRSSMRLLPYPVSILTTAPSPTAPATAIGHGITLGSLACLSLESTHPLISFNIKTPSTASAAIHAHPQNRFALHVLASSPHAVFLANAFAQLNVQADRCARKASPWQNLRAKVEFDEDSSVPLLGCGDGVVARWRCETVKVMPFLDHELWVGRVLRVEVWGEDDVERGERAGTGLYGLMYADRAFRYVGDEVIAEFLPPGKLAVDGSEAKDEPPGEVVEAESRGKSYIPLKSTTICVDDE